MILDHSSLQVGFNATSLAEWFVVSAVLVIVVALIYVYVLSRSPPPEKLTQMKLESYRTSLDPAKLLLSAEDAVKSGDFKACVDLSTKAAVLTLASLLEKPGTNLANMNVSDLAYLVQSKSPQSPDITQHLYNMNLLHLRTAQGQLLTAQEAQWALDTVRWLVQLTQSGQIRS